MTSPAVTSPAVRDRYLKDNVTTASPGQLVVMLYDRLLLDVTQAEGMLCAGDRYQTSQKLQHAQEIVMELRVALDTSAWSGADSLGRLYSFLLVELMSANVSGDADKLAACLTLVLPLRDAWRQALSIMPAETQPTAARAT